MQKLVKVQLRNGQFEDYPEFMAFDQRLQAKHGFRVVNIPTTVEELKAEVKHEELGLEDEGVSEGEPKRRGRKPKTT